MILAVFGCVLMLTKQISRNIGTGLVIVAITLGFAPIGESREMALAGHERGRIATLHGTTICVDSGSTSTSIPESMQHLMHIVTDERPNRKLHCQRFRLGYLEDR